MEDRIKRALAKEKLVQQMEDGPYAHRVRRAGARMILAPDLRKVIALLTDAAEMAEAHDFAAVPENAGR